MTRTAYLVSHTHWDREWYRTFQQFRLDLVRTVDDVLDTLERDPAFAHFLLDGQTIVLDDYLAMRPERAEQLRRFIAAGRLAVGPWYCHPDLFLVSGESIVRNLMLGLRVARSYGRALMVGYIPDQFGHSGQTPQILRGFGIESAVLWRGVNARETRNESWWEAPDGSRVLLELLAQSYSNAQILPLDSTALAERLRQLGELLTAGATGPGVLLMNGGDHQTIQSALPAALAAANHLLAPDWQVRQTGLGEALTRLHEEGQPAGVLRGELRSPATAHLLPGVLSTRIPLKRRNVQAQLLLEREVEPYATWAHLLGAEYPHGELWEAWRLLLQNQPHDSVCGCSIDQVHREMGIRYDGVEQIGTQLLARAHDYILDHIDTRLPDGAPSHTIPLVVLNASAGQRTERVALTLQFPGMAAGYDLHDAAGQPVPHRWVSAGGEPSTVMQVPRESIPSTGVILSQFQGNRMMGMGLQSLDTAVTGDGLQVEITVGDSGIMSREELEAAIWRVGGILDETAPLPVTLHIHRNARHELHLLARDVPAYGYTTLWLRPGDDDTLSASDEAIAATEEHAAPAERYAIANEFFTVRADPGTGALMITDHRTGATFGPCNVFVDGGDVGDSYTYAPPTLDTMVDRPAVSPVITVTIDDLGACLSVRQEFVTPAALTESRDARSSHTATLHIASMVTLTHGCPRIDVETTVVNTAEDHRLRVLFQAPIATDHVHAEGAFEVVRRPLGVLAMEGTALEDPVADAPQHGFVLAHGDGHGLLIANVGLPEYEAFSAGNGTTTIALTLLRCVGWLSRDDLPTRRGGAGPSLPVPDAQCPGTHTFTYSLIPLAGDWPAALDEAHHAQAPLRALAAYPTTGDLPSRGSFLQVDAPGVLVSAIKAAEDGEGIIVRLYNVSDTVSRGRLRLWRPLIHIERVTLDERTMQVLYSGEPIAEAQLELEPYRIETLRLRIAGLR